MKNTEVCFFFLNLTSHLKKTKMVVKSHVTRQSLTQSPADQKPRGFWLGDWVLCARHQ